MKNTPKPHKPLVWVASTKKELMALPVAIRSFFGHALDLAQRGDRHDSAKVLHGFGCAGVLEIVEDDAGGTYRAVYTVKFEEAVFVLHCFQKEEQERYRDAEAGNGSGARPPAECTTMDRGVTP